LLAAIVLVGVVAFGRIRAGLAEGLQGAVNGAVLAALNTGSEYGFGAVIAALPGFAVVREVLTASVRDPLLNVAVTTNVLSGITGSASGGMSIALGAMGQTYLQNALAAGISPEVLHRVAAMSSGGMDTLPHNGAVITLLTVTGLTHRQAYREILGMTVIKTAAVFLVIGLYTWLGVQ
jgi:H+/gluconate symporter-like permease